MSLKIIGIALISFIVSFPAQANESLKNCLNNHPQVSNTILTAFRDNAAISDTNPNRPLEYYQIGEEIDRERPESPHKNYDALLVLVYKSGQCQNIKITALFGYEPYVPDPAAVNMEMRDIEWRSRNFVQTEPLSPNETPEVTVTPEELGHGCEPWTKTMAEARKRKKLSLDGCPVRKQRLRLIWDR